MNQLNLQLNIKLEDLENLRKSHLFVVGDLILDHYIRGQVVRISPEAPVPVLKEGAHHSVPGGAGNVAANAAFFGANVQLAGRLGEDADGEIFRRHCIASGIDISATISSPQACTTRKTRILAGYQQLLRLDREEITPLLESEENRIAEHVEVFCAKKSLRVLVLSDYGKGVLSPNFIARLIKIAKAYNIPVVVDPKSIAIQRYFDATLIKPNLSEGRAILQADSPGLIFETLDEEISAIADVIFKKTNVQFVVLSLSDKGVGFFERGKKIISHIHSQALEVADVSGAGDTMTAFLGLCLAAKLPIDSAVQIANLACGIVCAKLGTATASFQEIYNRAFSKAGIGEHQKILNLESLTKGIKDLKTAGKKIIFTNGCFDILHFGHVDYLKKAKNLGDILIVGLNSDASVKNLKGEKRPIQSEHDRAEILSALESVDFVVVFNEDTPLKLILEIQPDILCKGGDYKLDSIVGSKEVIKAGGKVQIIPLIPNRSTSKIEKLIQEKL